MMDFRGIFPAVAALAIFAFQAPALAQSHKSETMGIGPRSREELSRMHREEPVPPPTRIPDRQRSGDESRGGRITFNGFTSVQVNVDADGFNIPGDAANEPSIAIDPTDPRNIVIGWRQFDTITSNFRQAGWAYSHDGGESWTFPGVLEPGQFRSDPVLDSDADGRFYYYSLSALDSAEMFISSDKGVTWDGPHPGFGGDKQWMIVDRTDGPGRGNVYANWNLAFSCCPGEFTRSIFGGLFFMEPVNIPQSPFWGTMTVAPNGILYIVGIGTNGLVVARSADAPIASLTPTFDQDVNFDLGGFIEVSTGPNPGGLLGQLWIAADHSPTANDGTLFVLASVNPPGADPLDVMFTRSTDWGTTWSPPVRVNDDPTNNGAWQWMGTMSVAPNGRIDAIWNDTRNTGASNLSQVFYSFSEDKGVTWSPDIPVSPVFDSHIGWPQQSKIGDYYHMISDNGGANLAYAATFNGEQDVYFLRITRALEPPAPAAGEHAARKNRFISVDLSANGSSIVAVEVRLASMKRCNGDLGSSCRADADCAGGTAPCVEHPDVGALLGWLGEPDANGLARVVNDPVFRVWDENPVHVGDCEIVPVATYELRATRDGAVFSDTLRIGTITKPGSRHYGDTVGEGTGGLGPLPGFTPPNGVVNIVDVQAYGLTAQGPSSPSAHVTWVDLHGNGTGTPPNMVANVADLQRILFGLDSQTYTNAPEHLNPGACP